MPKLVGSRKSAYYKSHSIHEGLDILLALWQTNHSTKRKISPEHAKEGYAAIIKSCDQNMQLMFRGNIDRLADMELYTIKVWPGMTTCFIYVWGGNSCSHFHSIQRFGKYKFLPQFLEPSFVHQHFTTWFNPSQSQTHPLGHLIASSVAASRHPLPCVRHPPSSSVIQAQYMCLRVISHCIITDWFDTTMINYSMDMISLAIMWIPEHSSNATFRMNKWNKCL